ncbi:hypothetical protein NPIL_583551 [Nephila pilipes]|uniref:Uncharacterized protein n=1 Tax=Nephila pilipes TaxID=299642 RepID=A0A8X6QA49_NEPPI|nr:hypothetical protein NPIL_583551 [Nephila pilipes]
MESPFPREIVITHTRNCADCNLRLEGFSFIVARFAAFDACAGGNRYIESSTSAAAVYLGWVSNLYEAGELFSRRVFLVFFAHSGGRAVTFNFLKTGGVRIAYLSHKEKLSHPLSKKGQQRNPSPSLFLLQFHTQPSASIAHLRARRRTVARTVARRFAERQKGKRGGKREYISRRWVHHPTECESSSPHLSIVPGAKRGFPVFYYLCDCRKTAKEKKKIKGKHLNKKNDEDLILRFGQMFPGLLSLTFIFRGSHRFSSFDRSRLQRKKLIIKLRKKKRSLRPSQPNSPVFLLCIGTLE